MIRSVIFGGLVVAFAVAAYCLQSSQVVTADEKGALTNEEIMKKLHSKTGSHKVLKKLLDADTLAWDEIGKQTKSYVDLTAALTKNKADKGDQSAWKKLCTEYADLAKKLNTAAGKKDKAGSKDVMGKLQETCEACHENHR